ncbi:MAG TPA: RNA pseudouridine synthase [Candidatus Absconditabacterales bacterium]|nr:RNA pseudouridine synthase [Candidatus Absconditabacterales bacterium]
MKITVYEDSFFYYFWKPHGIPSTFGKEKCFLDLLSESSDQYIKLVLSYLDNMFGKEQEYGLLNRLDNDTAGLLYFAKTPLVKEKYKKAQSEGRISKYYVADVYGNFVQNSLKVSYPIGHHKFSKDRMVVFLGAKQTGKIDKKKIHQVDTDVEKLYFDESRNVTTLLVKISKGIRHQIRAHLSSIGFPIVGEKIYIKKAGSEKLQLFSIGMKFKE